MGNQKTHTIEPVNKVTGPCGTSSLHHIRIHRNNLEAKNPIVPPKINDNMETHAQSWKNITNIS